LLQAQNKKVAPNVGPPGKGLKEWEGLGALKPACALSFSY